MTDAESPEAKSPVPDGPRPGANAINRQLHARAGCDNQLRVCFHTPTNNAEVRYVSRSSGRSHPLSVKNVLSVRNRYTNRQPSLAEI
jgi:hypothetical protein